MPLRNISRTYMKVLNILVMIVIIKLHFRNTFKDIFSQYTKVSNIIVISVTIRFHERIV